MTAATVQLDLFAAAAAPVPGRRPRDTRGDLRAVHTDYLRAREREALRLAVHACAAANGGRVHIAELRPFIPVIVAPQVIGAALNGWTRAGHLVETGEFAPMGGTAGNARKLAPVRRLNNPIPSEA